MASHTIFITGVSGSGKTTMGQALAEHLGYKFIDGDDFHSRENLEKMNANIPLNDEDRWPWLDSINQYIKTCAFSHVVVACSALKEIYRDRLAEGISSLKIQWVHLQGNFELIYQRLEQRIGHYMSSKLLKSQYEIYEKPQNGIFIDVSCPFELNLNHLIKEVKKSSVGIIGLGVMGSALARNIGSKKYSLSLYNRHVLGQEENIAEKAVQQYEALKEALAFNDLEKFVESLASPKKIILMIQAGKAVDEILDKLLPYLSEGDMIMDGGNSHFIDSQKREQNLLQKGIFFISCGISGGEEGALKGPSIMPGGSPKGYNLIKDLLKDIAAQNKQGSPCCNYVGSGGSGHFVKMVHNGIEYAEMQLIADIYAHLRFDQDKKVEEIRDIFKAWCLSDSSYLLEITLDILCKKDEDGELLLDKIRDIAENKGTGGWTTQAACDVGTGIPNITAALYARYHSSDKKHRTLLSNMYPKKHELIKTDIEGLKYTYLFCRIMNHIQGLEMIKLASQQYHWDIHIQSLLQTWSGGCIIRSQLLENMNASFKAEQHILQSDWIVDFINQKWEAIKNTISLLSQSNQPYAVVYAAIEYFKSMTQENSNANMIQAQRDYFGAHTYQRIDAGDDIFFHTLWQVN